MRVRAALLLTLLAACDWSTAARLPGRWESDDTPKRTLDLFSDGTYAQRLSGKTLGFLSDMLGPEKGKWSVEKGALVLTATDEKGATQTRSLPLGEVSGDRMVLSGERWHRVPPD